MSPRTEWEMVLDGLILRRRVTREDIRRYQALLVELTAAEEGDSLLIRVHLKLEPSL